MFLKINELKKRRLVAITFYLHNTTQYWNGKVILPKKYFDELYNDSTQKKINMSCQYNPNDLDFYLNVCIDVLCIFNRIINYTNLVNSLITIASACLLFVNELLFDQS